MKTTEKTVEKKSVKKEVEFFDGRERKWKVNGKKISIFDGLNPKGNYKTFGFSKQIWSTREKGKNFFCLVLLENGHYVLLKKSHEIKK